MELLNSSHDIFLYSCTRSSCIISNLATYHRKGAYVYLYIVRFYQSLLGLYTFHRFAAYGVFLLPIKNIEVSHLGFIVVVRALHRNNYECLSNQYSNTIYNDSIKNVKRQYKVLNRWCSSDRKSSGLLRDGII